MADQFAVFRNPGSNRYIPYLVTVQSNQFRDSIFCIVIPLVPVSALRVVDSNINPHVHIHGQTLTLDPLQITYIRSTSLKSPIASLAAEADRIVRALDILFSTAWP